MNTLVRALVTVVAVLVWGWISFAFNTGLIGKANPTAAGTKP
jgi:hypothetical protein